MTDRHFAALYDVALSRPNDDALICSLLWSETKDKERCNIPTNPFIIKMIDPPPQFYSLFSIWFCSQGGQNTLRVVLNFENEARLK